MSFAGVCRCILINGPCDVSAKAVQAQRSGEGGIILADQIHSIVAAVEFDGVVSRFRVLCRNRFRIGIDNQDFAGSRIAGDSIVYVNLPT